MKTKTKLLLVTLSLLLKSVLASGQTLNSVVPKGSTVFITSKDDLAQSDAEDQLKKSMYWNIVDDSDRADLFIEFVIIEERVDRYKGFIIVTSHKTGKIVFKSKTIDTLGTWTYHAKRAIVRKIIKKVIYDS